MTLWESKDDVPGSSDMSDGEDDEGMEGDKDKGSGVSVQFVKVGFGFFFLIILKTCQDTIQKPGKFFLPLRGDFEEKCVERCQNSSDSAEKLGITCSCMELVIPSSCLAWGILKRPISTCARF